MSIVDILLGAYIVIVIILFFFLTRNDIRQYKLRTKKMEQMKAWYETLDKDEKAHIMDVVWQYEDFRMKQRIYNTFKDIK